MPFKAHVKTAEKSLEGLQGVGATGCLAPGSGGPHIRRPPPFADAKHEYAFRGGTVIVCS